MFVCFLMKGHYCTRFISYWFEHLCSCNPITLGKRTLIYIELKASKFEDFTSKSIFYLFGGRGTGVMQLEGSQFPNQGLNSLYSSESLTS